MVTGGIIVITNQQVESIAKALDVFRIELPSWGFANTGTRFGKFLQPAAAGTTEEKFSRCRPGASLDGRLPHHRAARSVGPPQRRRGHRRCADAGSKHGLRAGAINPNIFQDQIYKYGSLGNPDPAVRKQALHHILESVEIARRLGSRDLSLWFADGSNYPGTQNIRHRRALV